MNEVEKLAMEMLFGAEQGRVTRRVVLRTATLDRVPAETEKEMPLADETRRAYEAAYHITNARRFESYSGYAYRAGQKDVTVPGLSGATVTLVKVLEDDRDTDSYGDGEYDMGSEGEIGLIFKVAFYDGVTVHLKKEGYADSYGKEFWDGPFRIVSPKEKTVVEYVYE